MFLFKAQDLSFAGTYSPKTIRLYINVSHLMCAEIGCKVWISCLSDHNCGSVRVPGGYTIKIRLQSKQEEALIVDR